ncbi:hypothetical protein D3C73_1043970 [compost metagenome]
MFGIHHGALQYTPADTGIGQILFLNRTKSNMFPANRFPCNSIGTNRTGSQLGGTNTAIRQLIRGNTLRTKMLSCH